MSQDCSEPGGEDTAAVNTQARPSSPWGEIEGGGQPGDG